MAGGCSKETQGSHRVGWGGRRCTSGGRDRGPFFVLALPLMRLLPGVIDEAHLVEHVHGVGTELVAGTLQQQQRQQQWGERQEQQSTTETPTCRGPESVA